MHYDTPGGREPQPQCGRGDCSCEHLNCMCLTISETNPVCLCNFK